jgi:hypothetical protein
MTPAPTNPLDETNPIPMTATEILNRLDERYGHKDNPESFDRETQGSSV